MHGHHNVLHTYLLIGCLRIIRTARELVTIYAFSFFSFYGYLVSGAIIRVETSIKTSIHCSSPRPIEGLSR